MMSIWLASFDPDHLIGLASQPMQAGLQCYLDDPRYRRGLADASPVGFTAFSVETGRTLGSAGIFQTWPGRGIGWMFASAAIALGDWARILRATRAQIDGALADGTFRRVETSVRADFPRAQRWAEALGMERALLEPGWGPEGEDVWLYRKLSPSRPTASLLEAGGVSAGEIAA